MVVYGARLSRMALTRLRSLRAMLAGNTGTSAAVTFTVDTTPPVVAVTTPVAGAVLNSSKPTLSGLAGQAGGDDPSVTLKLYAGSTVAGSPMQTYKVTPSGANWTTGAVAALADGTYTVLAEQSDEAGNTGKSAAVTFTIDTTLPAVTLTSPSADSSTSTEFESFSGAAGSCHTRSAPNHGEAVRGLDDHERGSSERSSWCRL